MCLLQSLLGGELQRACWNVLPLSDSDLLLPLFLPEQETGPYSMTIGNVQREKRHKERLSCETGCRRLRSAVLGEMRWVFGQQQCPGSEERVSKG